MKSTTLCYIEQNNKYLMLFRNKKHKDPNEGKWIGVGGHIEEGETADECVCREVLEETGLTLVDYRFRGLVHFISDEWEDEDMYLYTATGFYGTVKECNEGDLSWIEKEDVMKLNLWEGDRIFLEKLIESDDEFELELIYTGEKLTSSNYQKA